MGGGNSGFFLKGAFARGSIPWINAPPCRAGARRRALSIAEGGTGVKGFFPHLIAPARALTIIIFAFDQADAKFG
jgi:hypothetical protein